MQPQSRQSTVLANSQNFLKSGALVDRLLATSSIERGDLVLDLGAGTGVITDSLTKHGCRVIAVEQAPLLASHLRNRFAHIPHVQVLQCDLLHAPLPWCRYNVFSNIPFDITTSTVSRLTRASNPPDDAYVVVQQEAAERFVGVPRCTLVAALAFPWFEITVVHAFERRDFVPAPRVEVVMLRLRKRGPPLVMPEQAQLYRDFVVTVFSAPTHSLHETLKALLGKQLGARLAQHFWRTQATPSQTRPSEWVELFAATFRILGDQLRWRVAHAERRLHEHQRRLQKLHRTRGRHLRPPPAIVLKCTSARWRSRPSVDRAEPTVTTDN